MSVPKLRFKEFDGKWSKSSILDLSKEKALNNGVFNDQNKVGKGYKLINVLDMYIERDIDEARLSLLDLDAKEFERNKVKYGDIFFTRSSLVKEGIAFSNVYLGNANDVTYDGHLIKLSPDLERIDPIFLNFSLKTENVRKQLIQGGKTATMTTIGQKEVGGCQLDIPSKEEQTKIASFLSAVDEKISQLTQKHELLSQYKQGMMQKLFSQQIRFKADDGREFGEWEEKSLKDFIINHVGGAALTPNDFVSESEYEVIPKKAITFNGKLSLDENSPTYCTKSFFEENFKNTVNKDYLITVLRDLVPSGPSIGYIVQFRSSKTYILAQGVYGFQITSNLNKAFLIHFSNTKQYRLVMKSIMVGSTQVHIRNQDFFGIQIPVPCLEEQTKIANFLSSIDQKIEVVAQQIEQAKMWKKSLLQQMFV